MDADSPLSGAQRVTASHRHRSAHKCWNEALQTDSRTAKRLEITDVAAVLTEILAIIKRTLGRVARAAKNAAHKRMADREKGSSDRFSKSKMQTCTKGSQLSAYPENADNEMGAGVRHVYIYVRLYDGKLSTEAAPCRGNASGGAVDGDKT